RDGTRCVIVAGNGGDRWAGGRSHPDSGNVGERLPARTRCDYRHVLEPKGSAARGHMKKETIAAAAAAIALSGAAGAHEFVCEKTIEGEVIHVVHRYPATLQFRIIVTNTHPTDASTALWVRDDALANFRPAVPVTVEAGRSLELDAAITVRSEAECMSLSHAP